MTFIYLKPSIDHLSTIVPATFVGTLGGANPTLNAGDTLSGKGVQIALNITDVGVGGTAIVPKINVSGISSAVINSGEGVTVDTTAWRGLQTLNLASSDGNDTVTVGNDTALTVSDQSNGNSSILTYGGSSVAIKNAGLTYGNYVVVHGGAHTSKVAITGGYDDENYIYDTAGTIHSVSISNQYDYDTYIYDNALNQLSLTGITYHYVYVYSSGTGPVGGLMVTLNGDGLFPGYSGDYWYLEDDIHTSLVFTTTGVASTNFYLYAPEAHSLVFSDAVGLSFFDGGIAGSGYLDAPLATSITIAGLGNFTADLSQVGASATIDATEAFGVVKLILGSASTAADVGQTFSGGPGRDIVTIGEGQTGHVTGGSNAHNEIVLNNIAAASEADISPSIVSHFSILGIAGTTSGTFDLSALPVYKSFDIQGEGGDVTFEHASAAVLDFVGSSTFTTTLQTSDSSAATDTASLTLGTASTSGVSAGDVALQDATGASIGTVSIVSQGDGTGENAVTLLGSGSVHVTLSGTERMALTMGDGNNTITDLIGAGADITVGNGNNSIFGGNGDDTIVAGSGNDFMNGGLGHNTITTGAGTDIIALTNFGFDTITDFRASYSIVTQETINFDDLPGSVGGFAPITNYQGFSWSGTFVGKGFGAPYTSVDSVGNVAITEVNSGWGASSAQYFDALSIDMAAVSGTEVDVQGERGGSVVATLHLTLSGTPTHVTFDSTFTNINSLQVVRDDAVFSNIIFDNLTVSVPQQHQSHDVLQVGSQAIANGLLASAHDVSGGVSLDYQGYHAMLLGQSAANVAPDWFQVVAL